jgi:aminoglycoside phosphotransferase (APT) family kinase protein
MTLVSGSLLHNDYHKGHIYSDNNGISGIIDWEAAMVGVAEYDLAKSAHFMGSDFPKFLKGYGSDANIEYVQKYELLIAAQKMVWAHSSQPSRIEVKRSVLHAALSRTV